MPGCVCQQLDYVGLQVLDELIGLALAKILFAVCHLLLWWRLAGIEQGCVPIGLSVVT